jgi:aminoglycoside phosphotransferase (APT) family kinase protein
MGAEKWIEALRDRDWAIVIHHGDLVPWNVLRQPHGTVGAVDWEYGSLEGLPSVDLVHYILQVAALVYRWKPDKAMRYASEYLTQQQFAGLSRHEARATIRLTALWDYQNTLANEETVPHAPFLQEWRRRLWESQP